MRLMVLRTFFSFVAAVMLIGVGLSNARAYDAWRERAVVVDDKAYLLGKPEAIIAGDVSGVRVSPNGQYLLAERDTPVENRYMNGVVPPSASALRTAALYLLDARRHDPLVLWEASFDPARYVSVGNITWLADGETALVVVRQDVSVPAADPAADKPKPKYDTQLLIINARRRRVRTVSLGVGEEDALIVDLLPSPTRNEAVMAYRVGRTGTYRIRLVAATGELSAPIEESAAILSLIGWNADGTIATAMGAWNAASKSETPESAAERTRGWLQYDRRDHSIQRLSTAPGDTGFRADSREIQSLRLAKLPLRLAAQTGIVSSASLKREGVNCVYVESADGTDRVFVAAEATPVTILGDGLNFSLVYQYAGALFVEPAIPVSRDAYVEYIQKQLVSSVRQIQAGLQQWMMDNNTHSPPNGDLIAAIVGPDKYLLSDAGMRDPTSGKIDLNYFYTGAADSTGNVPLLSLSTSAGKCTLYTDGQIIWQPVFNKKSGGKE